MEAKDYASNLKKYTSTINEMALKGIVRHCGIALRSHDASLVSATDPKELALVRDSFLKKKLALEATDAELDAAIRTVVDKMKAERNKSRVTVYYLLAEHYEKLDLFA